jgi:hypothetical protein
MFIEKLISAVSRIFFIGAFVLLGVGVIERIAYEAGYTIAFSGGRLMEIAAVLLIFVIAMQLREMKGMLKKKNL